MFNKNLIHAMEYKNNFNANITHQLYKREL